MATESVNVRFAVVCYFTAALVVLSVAVGFTWFPIVPDPDESIAFRFVFAVLASLVAESGLLLAPSAVQRTSLVLRVVALVALLPALYLLAASLPSLFAIGARDPWVA